MAGQPRSTPDTDQPLGDPGRPSRAPARRPRRSLSLLPGAAPDLPPTAKRLLEAAHRLLVRSGYNSLTVEAITQEAGENKALVRYYFGSKNGLLVALTDSLIMETLSRARQRLAQTSDTHDRVSVITDAAETILRDEASYRLLFDLLPRLLENPRMARQLAHLYRGYRDINARALWGEDLGEPPALVRRLAAMTVALTDGLAVQVLAEPGSIDVPGVLATWRDFLENALAAATRPDVE